MDAILGALALGDIGHHFPDSDNKYKGIDSGVLCERVAAIMKEKKMAIGNLDVTIIAQKPKLAPYIDTMRENLARLFDCTKDKINVKATTEEGLGATGEGLAISTHAVALLIGE
jgi:2-C-methyl-D-erythritol 2,4-cyclodiphosphate synthase